MMYSVFATRFGGLRIMPIVSICIHPIKTPYGTRRSLFLDVDINAFRLNLVSLFCQNMAFPDAAIVHTLLSGFSDVSSAECIWIKSSPLAREARRCSLLHGRGLA
jgi:hypothetical protein